jgi:hypothetical protein
MICIFLVKFEHQNTPLPLRCAPLAPYFEFHIWNYLALDCMGLAFRDWHSGTGIPGLAFRDWHSGTGILGLAFWDWHSGTGIPNFFFFFFPNKTNSIKTGKNTKEATKNGTRRDDFFYWGCFKFFFFWLFVSLCETKKF